MDVAERNLTGMGPEYVSDLNHTNTLQELNRKLLLFMRVKWTECAVRIIESGQRPRFVDFLQFLKQRAILFDNEFGEDLNCSPSKDKEKSKGRDGQNRHPHKFTQWPQVHEACMIEALNTEARKEQMVLSKVVLSVPTSMVFGGVVNLKVCPIRRG